MIEGAIVEEKVQLKVYIPKSLDNALRNVISEKYGEFRKGYLSLEVEKALNFWISIFNEEHRVRKIGKHPGLKVEKVFEEVKSFLRNYFGYQVLLEVPIKHLKVAIANVRGGHPKTIRTWLKRFEENRLIRWKNHLEVEILPPPEYKLGVK